MVLVVTGSCGGGDSATPPTGNDARPTRTDTVQNLLDAFDGDGSAAGTAVALALDAGYSPRQVVDGVTDGGLGSDGTVTDETPDGEPLGLIEDEQAMRLIASVQGAGDTYSQQDLDKAMDTFFRDVRPIDDPDYPDRGARGFLGLEGIFQALEQGYSAEQVVSALILGDLQVKAVPGNIEVTIKDEEPASDPIDDLFLDPAAGDTTTTTTASEGDDDAGDQWHLTFTDDLVDDDSASLVEGTGTFSVDEGLVTGSGTGTYSGSGPCSVEGFESQPYEITGTFDFAIKGDLAGDDFTLDLDLTDGNAKVASGDAGALCVDIALDLARSFVKGKFPLEFGPVTVPAEDGGRGALSEKLGTAKANFEVTIRPA